MLQKSATLRLARATLAAILALHAPGPAASAPSMHAARADMRALLARVSRWGCQYQNIDVSSIAASSLDLIVVEPIVDPANARMASADELQLLKRKPNGDRRLVLAYLSVGAAEEYRSYWSPDWKTGAPPAWLGAENPEWPRSYSVRYWHPDWQRIVLEAVVRLVDTGFDGVFLDRVDAFNDWPEVRSKALPDMADFIAEVGETARRRNPGFLLVGQNAEPLLASRRYLDAIDAVSKESLLTGLKGYQVPNSPSDVEWSLRYLRPARNEGLTVLAIEYLDDDGLIAGAAHRHRQLRFVPFFGSRLLDRLP